MKQIILLLVICVICSCESQSAKLDKFEAENPRPIFEVYAAYDIFYLQQHPNYYNWVSISSEKFGELVQGCDMIQALEFLHHNSYKEVTHRYDYNYSSIE